MFVLFRFNILKLTLTHTGSHRVICRTSLMMSVETVSLQQLVEVAQSSLVTDDNIMGAADAAR